VTELLSSHDDILIDEDFLLMNKRIKWLLDRKSTPGEDAVKTI